MSSAGDLAAEAALRLQEEHLDAFIAAGAPAVDEESAMRAEARKSLFAKIEFRWRASDERILEQIDAACDAVFRDMFDDMMTVIDEIYRQTRVPDTDANGIVRCDSRGRTIWKTTPDGRPVEDWGQLTGQDVEKCLFDIARLKLAIATQRNSLLTEAIYAKHISDDAHQDAFSELIEDTIPGRNAYASRKARVDKYHAFFRYCLYSHVESFSREVDAFARTMERVLYHRINGKGR